MTFFNQNDFIKKHITNRSVSFFESDIADNQSTLKKRIQGKSILVIGGAGTIGSSFVKAVLSFGPGKITIVDHNENGLTEITRDLRSAYNHLLPKEYLAYPIDFGGNVFQKLFTSNHYDVVACFAAHKHVRSEKDPYAIEAMIRNNVFNTKKLLDLSLNNDVERFFCVSTDKAANPVNIMGASKKLMEKVLMSYTDKLQITTARFANVAFSNGSLLYGFDSRISKSQPISAPQDVQRYFVSPIESGQLCMLACFLGESSDIFYPKLKENQMKTFSSIAEKYLEARGLKPDYSNSEEEARTKAKEWDNTNNNYPVFFSQSDTSGEKQYEEFFDHKDELDLNAFKALGVIKNTTKEDQKYVEDLLNDFESLFQKSNLEKQEIVTIIKSYLPLFQHIETGKNLDQKM